MSQSAALALVIAALLAAGALGISVGRWVYHPPEGSLPWFRRAAVTLGCLAVVSAIVGAVLWIAD